MKPLSKDERRAVCVHEAGHAVIHALGGNYVFRVAVAPEGATQWTFDGRKGGALSGLWGACEPSDLWTPYQFMSWDGDEWEYRVDRAAFTAWCRDLDRQAVEQGYRVGMLAAERNALRRALFGALAGPIAEAIHLDQRPEYATYADLVSNEGDDISKAVAFSRLLPWRNEYEHAQHLTEQTLRRRDVWSMVLRLADELERVGSIEDGIDAYLPAKVPNWPPSPRARRDRPFVVRPLEV